VVWKSKKLCKTALSSVKLSVNVQRLFGLMLEATFVHVQKCRTIDKSVKEAVWTLADSENHSV
jgi:hypothetical protein